jgi:hypothetical protein
MKTWVGIAALAALLGGCAGMDTAEFRPLAACSGSSPNTDDCDIALTVTPSTDPAVVCTVAVATGLSVVPFRIPHGQSKKIQWMLNTTAFRFRHKGIEFKDPDAPFTSGSSNPAGSVYKVNNNGKKNPGGPAEDYAYGIHLERVSDKMLCGFDPLIRNQ